MCRIQIRDVYWPSKRNSVAASFIFETVRWWKASLLQMFDNKTLKHLHVFVKFSSFHFNVTIINGRDVKFDWDIRNILVFYFSEKYEKLNPNSQLLNIQHVINCRGVATDTKQTKNNRKQTKVLRFCIGDCSWMMRNWKILQKLEILKRVFSLWICFCNGHQCFDEDTILCYLVFIKEATTNQPE